MHKENNNGYLRFVYNKTGEKQGQKLSLNQSSDIIGLNTGLKYKGNNESFYWVPDMQPTKKITFRH